jgi:RNA polymerase sigma-70 factor (ECF subfamily)
MGTTMDQRKSTEDLILQARKGDRLAFEELVRAYRPRLEALVRLRIGVNLRGKLDVDDVAQETLLKAYQAIDSLQSSAPNAFFGWLAGIAHHVILNQARYHERRPAVTLSGSAAAEGSSPSKGLRRSERFDRLQEALDALTADHREVILLARIEGLPMSEVASRMNRTPGAVAQLLWRALNNLRERFGETESLNLPQRQFHAPGDTNERQARE